MDFLDINAIRALLQGAPRNHRPLRIARHEIATSEQMLEIHRASKNLFDSPEDFLHESILQSNYIESRAEAEEELRGMDESYILNRKASASETRLVYRQLSPLSHALPWKFQIKDAILLFDLWNEQWLFIETHGGHYVSAKWCTSA